MQTRSRKSLITNQETENNDVKIPKSTTRNKQTNSSSSSQEEKKSVSFVYTHLFTLSLTVQFVKESFFQLFFNSSSKTEDGRVAVITLSIQCLHFIYAIANLYILSSLLPSITMKTLSLKSLSFNGITSLTSMRLLVTIVAFFLILDNIRYSSLLGQNELLHHMFSRLCFFSHEAVTPFSLLLLPALLRWISTTTRDNNNSDSTTHNDIMYIDIIAMLASFIFSIFGFIRYLHMSEWRMEYSVPGYGVSVCRPAHSSHAALVPIFINVIGLILVPSISLLAYPGANLLDPKTSKKLTILLVSQSIVLIGNGVVGPRKLLMTLFGNGFEVLWLWSIVQCLHSS